MNDYIFPITIVLVVAIVCGFLGFIAWTGITKNTQVARDCIANGGSWVDQVNLCINGKKP